MRLVNQRTIGGTIVLFAGLAWAKIWDWGIGHALDKLWSSLMGIRWESIPWSSIGSPIMCVVGLAIVFWPRLKRVAANARAALLGEAPIMAVHQKMDEAMSQMQVVLERLAAINAYSNEQEARINSAISVFNKGYEKLNTDMAPILLKFRNEERNKIADAIEHTMTEFTERIKTQPFSGDIANGIIQRNMHNWGSLGLADEMNKARESAVKMVCDDIRLCTRLDDEEKRVWRTDDEKKSWKVFEAVAKAYIRVLRV